MGNNDLVGLEIFKLPRAVVTARTCLVWRRGHQSGVLDALRSRLPRGDR
jgi:hypothetical protein